jgi:acyl dehydratase
MSEGQNVVRFKDQAYQVETQSPGLNDDSLAEALRLKGVDYRGARATIEITHDNIRDFCNYMGSENPLFLDDAYAAQTRWGGIIAPPAMVGQAIIAPGLRGIQWIYAGIEWEFLQVMRPGDVITQRGHLVDAVEKQGRTVPRMILQMGRVECTRQDGVLVARSRVYHMRTPRRQAPGGMNYDSQSHRWSGAELAALELEMAEETLRGNHPRYWEEVLEGETLPPVVYGPLRVVEVAFTGSYTDSGAFNAEGVAHNGAHVYQLLNRRRHPADTYIDPESGMQDHPHRGHWEKFMAHEVGMPGVYDMGPHRVSWLCRYITDWMGDNAFLVRLSASLRRPNLVGDVTRLHGHVTRKWAEGDFHLVECTLQAVNQRGETIMPGSAVVCLPSIHSSEEQALIPSRL